MRIDLIPSGTDVPHSVNVLIEVPIGGEPVKYEFDKPSGAIFVDRILHTPMRYPCNYGFIPQTLCGDGDPLDVLVMTRWTLQPGSVIACRPIGVLYLEDEAGGDEKILAVPVTRVSPYYKDVNDYTDLPPIVVEQIFALPGLGNYFIQASLNRDEPLIIGIVAFISITLLFMNLLVDIAYAYLDPRVRYQ